MHAHMHVHMNTYRCEIWGDVMQPKGPGATWYVGMGGWGHTLVPCVHHFASLVLLSCLNIEHLWAETGGRGSHPQTHRHPGRPGDGPHPAAALTLPGWRGV